MQAHHPDKAAPELLEMLRAMDPTDLYELLVGHGREGEWGPPDRPTRAVIASRRRGTRPRWRTGRGYAYDPRSLSSRLRSRV